jgi:HD-GYP domain-containing protein (c-di-GMP phosphodiesterase class II)/DNA-binding SARP family transcriptional activator
MKKSEKEISHDLAGIESEDVSMFAPSGIFYLDGEGKILFVNSTAEKILDITFDDVRDQKVSELEWQAFQEDGAEFPQGKTPIEMVLHNGEMLTDIVMGVKMAEDDKVRWLLVSALPVMGENGKTPSQIHVELRDISQGIQKVREIKSKMTMLDQIRQTLESLGFNSDSQVDVYEQIIEFLPQVYSYPDITKAKLDIGDVVYTSKGFKESPINKSIQFQITNSKIGKIEFHYLVDKASELPSHGYSTDESLLKAFAEWIEPIARITEKLKRIEDLEEEALSAYDRMIEAWSAAMETKEKKTGGHVNRITQMALELAREMGFEEDELPNIRRGALLHDIGKLGIPDDIILKPGKLTDDEYQIMKKYPQYAEEWLSEIEVLQPAMEIPYYHNERWDGTGYPKGLKGEEIPLSARMFSVVNVWDALISDRPYRKAMSKEEALDLIVSESGSHFDPDVVESFLRLLSERDYIDTSYEIKIQAFGQERVWFKNRLVTSKDWQVNAAQDLFFLLLAHPEGLTKEQVGLYMWRDASPEDLNVRFKNTLYRLRKALGNQSILLGNYGYRFNKMLDYYYDVEIFTAQIEKADQTEDVLEKVSHLNMAIREYQGNYLPNFDNLWVIADRESYRQSYLKAVMQLAQYHYEEQELQAALRYCQQALIEDPMLEEVHRLAMKIHAMSGNRAEVIRQYNLCKRVLVDNYGITPSEKTHELYQSLINS